MVNVNWPEQKRSRPTKARSSRSIMVLGETIERPKATILAGVVLCSKCKCEAELEVVLDRQNQPIPSVFDKIGTSSRDRAGQKDYPTPAERNKRMTEQPKKEIPSKMPENEKPLAAIIEGSWFWREKNRVLGAGSIALSPAPAIWQSWEGQRPGAVRSVRVETWCLVLALQIRQRCPGNFRSALGPSARVFEGRARVWLGVGTGLQEREETKTIRRRGESGLSFDFGLGP
ncbi:hypothetical protein GBA52_026250 [Prunus armeniaca]|nr:hypothetical protein GBA52_026250 [Prunus armeniaca]